MRSYAIGFLFAALCCAPGLSQTVPQWKVVKVLKLTSVAGVNSATLFTPSAVNDYRLSVWIIGPQLAGSGEECETNLNWEDSLGGTPEAIVVFYEGVGFNTSAWASNVFAITPEAKQPVTYSVSCPFEYRLRIVVEKLE